MEYLIQFIAFYLISIFLMFFYFYQRLNTQDKYLSTYMRAFAENKGITLPPELKTTEVKIEDDRKPEVYSPRHDQETVMQGKVIDPFD